MIYPHDYLRVIHRVTQEVRVDVLGDPCLGCDLLHKLLKAPR